MGLKDFILKKINIKKNIKNQKNHGSPLGLAVLFSRQILNGSQDFFLFNIFIYFFKYETIETHARAFLILNILAIGRVYLDTYI